MRWFWLSALAFALSGCALPAAVSFATLAADAGSFMISGKTVADHGLSVALDRDCAMLRVFEGDICQDEPDYEVAVATLVPLPDGGGDLDIAVAAGSEPVSDQETRPSDHWGLAYGVQLAGRSDQNDMPLGDYLAAEFIEPQPQSNSK
jgi:hypothetical protein